MKKFTHLHVHSHYSVLDGLSKIDELVERAKELGFEALALTDHGNLYGVIEFYKKAKKAGIKPIIGVEAYLAPRSRFDKVPRIDSKNYHLTLLAKNETGYKNLIKLITKAWLEGFYYKPRIDKELLKEHSEGLIILSGCLTGEIPQLILNRKFSEARQKIYEYIDIVGKDDFYLEVNYHPEIKETEIVKKALQEISQLTDLKLVFSYDSHYLRKQDREVHDVLLAVQTGNKVAEEDRLTLKNADLSLISAQEAYQILADLPSAVETTEEIAEKCNLDLKLGEILMPYFPLPPGEDADSYLRKLVFQGVERRGLSLTDEKISQRIEHELEVIKKTGFANYFLIIQDFVHWAKNNGIVVGPGRGSVGGSLVAYLLGITEINPLEYDLIFERFLTPERVSPPDIDLDFTDIRRDEVFEYLKRKYGHTQVAQIITFGKMAARAAVRDAGRALGYSYSYCDTLAKLIPFNLSLKEALETIPELEEFYQKDKRAKILLDSAQKLEGTVRHVSVHACGTVIGPKDLTEYLPLQFAPQDNSKIITQYDMYSIEELGLLKIDLLGLRNLTTIELAKKIIQQRHQVLIDFKESKFDDPKTFQLFQKGETTGVFQLESAGMKRYLRQLKPETLEDLVVMIALYRPGPLELIPSYLRRRKGEEEIVYLHPKLKNILGSTYGIAVFQEQLMKIAVELAGFSLSEADVLRKAVGKKIKSLLEKLGNKMIEGMRKNGISKKIAQAIWEWYQPFARYGFNKSHAVAYAIIAYQTAYLKTHYPLEFMTALFNTEGKDLDRVKELIEEARRMKIQVLPPDINESEVGFAISGKSIRFGLGAIKNVGTALVEAIEKEKKENGPFESLEDFFLRINSKDLNRKSLEGLIKAGALDRFAKREELIENLDELIEIFHKIRTGIFQPQKSLFSAHSKPKIKLKPAKPLTNFEKYQLEKEYLGIYLTGHPLDELEKDFQERHLSISDALKMKSNSGNSLKFLGVVNTLKRILTKNKEPLLIVELEDKKSKIEAIAFPKIYLSLPPISEGEIILVSGKVDERRGTRQIIIDSVEKLL